MFYEADQDNPDKPTTLSLRDDPEPALQKAREQALRERYSGPIGGAIGGIGLVVVLALLYVVFNDYVAHKQELPALIARGRGIPAQLSGEPVHVGLRYRYTPEWRVEYSYTVNGRAHAGSAYMSDRPASIAVVFDPQNPAAHRAVGSMEPSNVDGRRLIMLGAAAVAFGFMFLISGPIEWLKRLRE